MVGPVVQVLVLGLVTAASPAEDAGIGAEADVACLECHRDPGAEDTLSKSLHTDVACKDCHADLWCDGQGRTDEPRPFEHRRDCAARGAEQCTECHYQKPTQTLESVHHALVADGKLEVAACTDCHGAHDMGKADERSRISKACARCHEKVAAVYAKSVHGSALLEEGNPDVPTCTDCHWAHDTVDPTMGAWRLNSPEVCGGCHTNERMMKKYGLSTAVLSSYLSDFHGATTVLQKSESVERPVVALCSDCHGVHDITKVDDPNSRVIQGNLVKTCRKCHPDATDNFPGAWLSHYEPTLEKAPLVWAVRWLYKILIPFMIGSLLLQIVLHVWRVVVNR